jgi:hypothetical protein
MFRNLITILISVSASLAVTLFVVKVAVLPPLGAFTTLNSTDVIRDFPTTYNANLAKTIEVGTTSIASITTLPNLVSHGTTTTGGFQGSIIGVAYGGTGSTTFGNLQNAVLISNTTNGVGSLDNLGTDGQFLTSRGVGSSPHWTTSAIDLKGNYVWTGTHTWNAPTTSIRNLNIVNASTTINGLLYTFPSVFPSQSASGSVLTLIQSTPNSATGTLAWIPNLPAFIASTTPIGSGVAGVMTASYGHPLGRRPTFITADVTTLVTDGSVSNGCISHGSATSTGNSQSVIFESHGTNAAGEVLSGSLLGSIILCQDKGGTERLRGTLTSITDSIFTVTWNTNSNTGADANRNIIWKLW